MDMERREKNRAYSVEVMKEEEAEEEERWRGCRMKWC
jgi:hypothetical protein